MNEVQAMAKVLYVAANWQETISEPDGSTKPQSEYERRAAEKWDKGTAGWSNYQRYPRYAAALSAAGFGDVREQQARIDAVEALADELSRDGERAEHYADHGQIQASGVREAIEGAEIADRIRAALTATEGA